MQLERGTVPSQCTNDVPFADVDDSGQSPSPPPDFCMTTLDLGPPIATLRSLGALPGRVQGSSPSNISTPPGQRCPHDPVAAGVISRADAHRAVEM